MSRLTGTRPESNGRRTSATMVECRHLFEACSHRIQAARTCGRYSVSGGRFGHVAASLIL